MAAALIETYDQQISGLELIPSGGGVFEVEVDGTLVYSKRASKRHANPQEVLDAIAALNA